MSKMRHAGLLAIDLAFALFLFYLSGSVLLGEETLFGLGTVPSSILAALALVLGGMALVRSFKGFLLITGQAQPQDEEVPEYGYRDEWERRNL